MTEQIEGQIERFAPGFRDRVLARNVRTPADFEQANPNYIGGDIVGGLHDLRQLVAPARRLAVSVFDNGPGDLPLLGVHASRRWRARHVRLLRRPRGAPVSLKGSPADGRIPRVGDG